MQQMFELAAAFNSDLSAWDTGAVTSMGYMFSGAADFNSDVSSWRKCYLGRGLYNRIRVTTCPGTATTC